MSFTKQELGRHLYLYRQPLPTTSVVIASHGGYRPSTQTMDLRAIDDDNGRGSLAGISVYFFKRHGFASGFKLLNGLGSTDYQGFEEYLISDAPGQKGKSIIVNYEVSKFEDDDSDNIIKAMKQIHADKSPGVPIRDVITIRNRTGPLAKVVTLEKVIRKAVPLGYRRFYCLFCRSQMEQNAIKLEAFKRLDPDLPDDHPNQKMIPDSDFKQWERTRLKSHP